MNEKELTLLLKQVQDSSLSVADAVCRRTAARVLDHLDEAPIVVLGDGAVQGQGLIGQVLLDLFNLVRAE